MRVELATLRSTESEMPSLIRSISAALLLATVALTGVAGSAFAASGNSAQPSRSNFGDTYCWTDGTWTYCFEQNGSLHYVSTPSGREMGTINFRQKTLIYQNGELVGETYQVSLDKSVDVVGGVTSFQTVEHVNARGVDWKCVSTTILKIVNYDFENPVVSQYSVSCS
jgi:hypothetical protein